MSRLCLGVRDDDVIVVDNGLILVRVIHRAGKLCLHFDAPMSVTINRLKVHEARSRARRQQARNGPQQT